MQEKVRDLVRLELTQFERYVLIQILDTAWKENLHSMDQIRDSISFRAFSQKDPRIEFKRESARVFKEMQDTIRDRVVDIAFRGRLSPQVPRQAPRPQMPAAGAPAGIGSDSNAITNAPPQEVAVPVAAQRALAAENPVDPASIAVVGRNEPCPCGSGVKYRLCHGKKPDQVA